MNTTTPVVSLASTSTARDELELKTVRAAMVGDKEALETGLTELKRLKAMAPQLGVVTATPPSMA